MNQDRRQSQTFGINAQAHVIFHHRKPINIMWGKNSQLSASEFAILSAGNTKDVCESTNAQMKLSGNLLQLP